MLQEDLSLIGRWGLKWQMQLNPAKCKEMHIVCQSFTIIDRLNVVELPVVTEIVDLGICVQASQSLRMQLTSDANRAWRVLFAICRAFDEIVPEIFQHLHATLGRSPLDMAYRCGSHFFSGIERYSSGFSDVL